MKATVILLPLQQEDETEPRYKWATRLAATEAAGPNARLRVRTRLTVARWPGNIDAASRVADKLVDNAFRHAKPFGPGEGSIDLRLTVLAGTDELLIEVDDALPESDHRPYCGRDLGGTPGHAHLEQCHQHTVDDQQ
ncbi:hypothetical protein ACWDG1_47390, partial [Streptomyces sp. NPDC001177]